MYILINPNDESIESVAILEQDALLAFLGDEDITTWPLGRMLAVTGANALTKPEAAFTVLKVGSGAQPLRGPIILMAQRGFFLDEDIISHLVDDLRKTAVFYRAVKDVVSGKPLLINRDGTKSMEHSLLDGCAIS